MNQFFKTFILLAALTALMTFVGYSIGGYSGLTFALAFAIIFNFGAYWFSDQFVIALTKAQLFELERIPLLHNKVIEYCNRMNLPIPAFYIIPENSPNAFATGRSPSHSSVCVTEGLMQMLSIEEIAAVIAHELGHIKNRDILLSSIAAVMVGSLSTIGNIAYMGSFSSRDRQNSSLIGLVVAIVVAPLAATLLQFAISRSREYAADEISAKVVGSAKPLIDALSKIESVAINMPANFNKGIAAMCIVNPIPPEMFSELFRTHPSLEKRIERLIQATV
jgi:heat shock protein HtpX